MFIKKAMHYIIGMITILSASETNYNGYEYIFFTRNVFDSNKIVQIKVKNIDEVKWDELFFLTDNDDEYIFEIQGDHFEVKREYHGIGGLWFPFVFTTLLLSMAIINAQTFNLGGREYVQVGGQWYINKDGIIGDQVIPDVKGDDRFKVQNGNIFINSVHSVQLSLCELNG